MGSKGEERTEEETWERKEGGKGRGKKRGEERERTRSGSPISSLITLTIQFLQIGSASQYFYPISTAKTVVDEGFTHEPLESINFLM